MKLMATAVVEDGAVHAKCGEHELWWLLPITDESEPIDGSFDIPDDVGALLWAAAKAVPQ